MCSASDTVPDGQRLVAAAEELAADLLRHDSQRWAHTQAVAARAEQAGIGLNPEQVPALLAAAWLHDIGYAPELHDTGLHPLDGARYIARVRGLERQMRPFDRPEHTDGPLADALTWADQTSSPHGQSVDVHTRLADMLTRHGPDSPNAHAHPERGPAIQQAAADTTDRVLLRRASNRLSRTPG